LPNNRFAGISTFPSTTTGITVFSFHLLPISSPSAAQHSRTLETGPLRQERHKQSLGAEGSARTGAGIQRSTPVFHVWINLEMNTIKKKKRQHFQLIAYVL
jgi:hypothetical protein